MNQLTKLSGCVASLFLILFLAVLGSSPAFAADVCDKRPDLPKCNPDPDPPPEPDPDPVDPGITCADTGSNFPAFVYEMDEQLFLSNAAGDCTVVIYGTDHAIPWGLSFRYFPDDAEPTSGYGRLAWLEYDFQNGVVQTRQLYTAEFQVDHGAVVETLPLTPTPLMAESVTYPERYISDPALSANASKIYVTGPGDNYEKHFIDVFDLESGERSRIFETTADQDTDVAIYGLQPGLEDQRIYFRLWPMYAEDGSIDWTQSLVFIERDEDGNWPEIAYDAFDPRLSAEPTEIMTDDYRHGSALSLGFWDHDGDGELNTVLSQSSRIMDFWEVEILDVENCVNGYESCVVLGTRSVSGLAFEGDRPSLTSFSENPPGLLYTNADAVGLDLNTGIWQTLIKAKNKNFPVSDVVSAD